jgi:hypothetical protein
LTVQGFTLSLQPLATISLPLRGRPQNPLASEKLKLETKN